MAYLYIFIGGGLGALSRFGITQLVDKTTKVSFPYGTMTANVLGSFFIGIIVAWFESKTNAFAHWRPLFVTGFLGGFTTFSSFSHETLHLFKNHGMITGLANTGGNVLLCLLFVYIGYGLIKGF